jgi:hypothetical protein
VVNSGEKESVKYIESVIIKRRIGLQNAELYLTWAKLSPVGQRLNILQRGVDAEAQPADALTAAANEIMPANPCSKPGTADVPANETLRPLQRNSSTLSGRAVSNSTRCRRIEATAVVENDDDDDEMSTQPIPLSLENAIDINGLISSRSRSLRTKKAPFTAGTLPATGVSNSLAATLTPFSHAATTAENSATNDCPGTSKASAKPSLRKQYLDDAVKSFDPATFRIRGQSQLSIGTTQSVLEGNSAAEPRVTKPTETSYTTATVPVDGNISPPVRNLKRQLVIGSSPDSTSSSSSTSVGAKARRISTDSEDTHDTASTRSCENEVTATVTTNICNDDDNSEVIVVNLKTASLPRTKAAVKGDWTAARPEPSSILGFDISVVECDKINNSGSNTAFSGSTDGTDVRTKTATQITEHDKAKQVKTLTASKKKRVSFAGNERPALELGSAAGVTTDENPQRKMDGATITTTSTTLAAPVPMKRSRTTNSVPYSVLASTSTTGSAASSSSSSSSTSAASAGSKQFDSALQLLFSSATNDYFNIGLLGKGGSSSVYRVLSRKDNQLYAFKRVDINKHSSSDSVDAAFESYMNELDVLKKLQGSDYIIQLIDCSVNQEEMCINLVMEMGEVDLAKLLSQKQKQQISLTQQQHQAAPFSVQHTNDVGHSISNPFFARMVWQEMLHAVDYIHLHNVVHGEQMLHDLICLYGSCLISGDLKPANFVFVKGHLKLIDFGIAKVVSNDTTNIYRDSQTGTVSFF